ncbi:hypothetical protein EV146_11188 [Mesobacillus foraminis]|uniref:Uncharacterized protein n=1 Tax=Mesobacillus foraminis TaxID=279826 RepID=A0A4R2B699_9BACI|nr:hypothetical protein EV146_11188 [Mesobacillus foraminis]
MIQAEAFGGVSKVYHTTAGRGFTRYFGEGNKFFGGGGYGEGGILCVTSCGEKQGERSRKREMRARWRRKAGREVTKEKYVINPLDKRGEFCVPRTR